MDDELTPIHGEDKEDLLQALAILKKTVNELLDNTIQKIENDEFEYFEELKAEMEFFEAIMEPMLEQKIHDELGGDNG